MPHVQQIVDFIRSDPTLFSLYLLFIETQENTSSDDGVSYLVFLAWYLVHGRTVYPISIVIDRDIKSALSFPDRDLCTPIMYFAALEQNIAHKGPKLRAWYYSEGIRTCRAAALLCWEELVALDQSGPPPMAEPSGAGSEVQTDGTAFSQCLVDLAAGAARSKPLPTVSIVGFHRSVLGLGEDARCLFDCLCELGVAAELIDVSPPSLSKATRMSRYEPFEVPRPTGTIIIFCLPPFETARAIAALNFSSKPAGQYRIGYWAWETTALPAVWRHVYDLVDEVWASSTFLLEVFRGETDKPVTYVPLNVRVDDPVLPADLAALFEGRFTFLSVFDFNSRIERKNPLGCIEAFRIAFPRGQPGVQLMLKTLHADHRPKDLARIVEAIGDDPRILIVDGDLDRAELCGLIARADAYVSLHRSEGFGRPLAEAMLLGTPVIATGWSGCADFLDETTGYPVRSVLRDVKPEEYPFAAGIWAEPDVEHAAELMALLFKKPRNFLRQSAVQDRIGSQFASYTVAAMLWEHVKAAEPHILWPGMPVCKH